ncbi:LysR family transcriptional regulator [bacterium SCSIO 12741]|nr:LysR family transcriptional regulator [bacterium SCSIO 12741]
MQYPIHYRFWISGEEGTFLGQGRITLLEAIAETGSINKAAQSMKMSYRKAWKLIDSMNAQAPNPLVVRVSGGAGGGGTQLTDDGRRVLDEYKKLQEKIRTYFEEELSSFDWKT